VTVALIVLIPLSALELAVKAPSIHFSTGLAAGLVYIGLFASLIAFLSWNRAIELAGPQRCAGFLNLIPLFSAIFATSFTGESLRWYHGIGAALIIAGVYVTNAAIKYYQGQARGGRSLQLDVNLNGSSRNP